MVEPEPKEAVALGVIQAGAKMIIEAVTSTSIREEVVDYGCRFHIESMIREIRRVLPAHDAGVTRPVQARGRA